MLLKHTPLRTNVVCPQFPHCKVWGTILTSGAGYSIKCDEGHEHAWNCAWHTETKTTHILDLIHCSDINAHLLWAELCPSQNAYVQVLTPSASACDRICR